MRVTAVIRAMALLALLAGTAAAGVKYVAVVETDVDASSGASDELKPAEVREITAELRRQATENLPRDKYSVMTSETVQSMGGAVLEECAEENCVVALGSRIGADYIVRGTVSKFQTMFTLAIELYETDNGTLVVSSEAVRSENLVELLKMTATASGNMFRKFAGGQNVSAATTLQTKTESEVVVHKSESITNKKRKHDYYLAPKYQFGRHPFLGGVNLEGGVVWGKGAFVGIDAGIGDWVEGKDDRVINQQIEFGASINFGNTYNFGDSLQLVYGGSVGIWYMNDYKEDYNKGSSDHKSRDYLSYVGPFVKLRWKFVELTYRGLLGLYDEKWVSDRHYADICWTHQLMLGLYFATNKRER